MPAQQIRLLPHTLEHIRALAESVKTYERHLGIAVATGVREFLIGAETSDAFRERLRAATVSDPWKDGFGIVHVADNMLIGLCSFGGPPSDNGTVEISYGIAPDYRGRGFATEAARTLIARAFANGRVRTIHAHTLPERSASTRVLEKCGFTLLGEVTHPEDGLIWRWELRNEKI